MSSAAAATTTAAGGAGSATARAATGRGAGMGGWRIGSVKTAQVVKLRHRLHAALTAVAVISSIVDVLNADERVIRRRLTVLDMLRHEMQGFNVRLQLRMLRLPV